MSESEWKISTLAGKETQWIPILRHSENQPWIGIAAQASWVVETDAGLDLMEGAKVMALLPFMEGPRAEFEAKLLESLRRNAVSELELEKLPIDDLLSAALRSGSEYWEKLGLEWIGASVAQQVADALAWVVANGATQAIRHRAGKLLKNTERREPC